MPYCSQCGNTRSFGSSKVPPVSSYTNGPLSGMMGEFDSSDEIQHISSLGASKNMVSAAVRKPKTFFDICLKCGSDKVEW